MRYGYFDNVNREYVIEKVDVPVSFTNYIGTERMGGVLSHNAGGYVWLNSPQYHRITRFRPNGIPLDRPGHYVYLRDDESGKYWSVSWQPCNLPLDSAHYECRHGLSYSSFSCEYEGIFAKQTIFIPRHDDVELIDITIENRSDTARTLSVYGYVEFSYHHIDMDNQNFQMSLYATGSRYVDHTVEYELHYEENSHQFFTLCDTPDGYDCLRDAFIGAYHTETDPIAVQKGMMSSSQGLCYNHCGALQKKVTLAANETKRLVFILGTGNADVARSMREKYSFEKVDAARNALARYWEEKLDKLVVKTPNESMNTSLNIWNLYQSEVNVQFSRFASFIEVGGRTGLGYRDTAQDAMCIPHSNPSMCKTRIRQLLNGLVSQGYGLHLFDPAWFNEEKRQSFKSPTVVPSFDKNTMIHGLEDVCADDALWLIPAIVEFICETGETDFLSEIIHYADQGEGSVYEHMLKILDFSFEQVGQSGICKGLRADWNDCLNLGGGESAMVSFLLLWAVEHFVTIASPQDKEKYLSLAQTMRESCQRELWDGEWFLRGITGKGKPIGSHASKEGKIHLESNVWAVISGGASKEQGEKSMDNVDKYLFTPYGLMLNAPAFETPDDDIGFVTRVYKGIKENGAVFSHPNPWAWVAEAMLGRGDRAMKHYNALLPINQNDIIDKRMAEPYVYCQFIAGKESEWYGRANHPWMTGSAGWAYYAATRYLLGVRPQLNELIVDPCIPSDWETFQVTRVWRGATYDITVNNPSHVQKGVKRITVNGEIVSAIPLVKPGDKVYVTVLMG